MNTKETSNYDANLFEQNNKIVGEILKSSWTQNSVEDYTQELFFTISHEEIKNRDEKKEKVMKDPYKEIRKRHRKDLD